MVELVFFSLLNGVVYGLLLFMLSSGLTLIFSMMGVLNFAHASLFMLGAYFAYEVGRAVGFWPALVVAPVAVGLLGAAIERWGLRTVHRFGHVAELLFTFGLALVIEEVVQLVWGRSAVPYDVPPQLDFTMFSVFDTAYPAYKGFMVLVSVAMFGVLALVLTRTRIGLVIQAALTHPDMVAMLGHNVPRVFMLVFGVGSALAGLAGVIGGFALVTSPGLAQTVGSIVFVVIIVGGLGSLTGAFAASLMIGVLQTFAVALDFSFLDLFARLGVPAGPGDALYDLWKVKFAQIGPVLPYFILVLMLVVRPRGLMGTRET
ncbi:MAG TPA: branched-chain amino acid ABC transporter permease [Stellaceae bacterium]